MNFATNIKNIRKENNLSQEQLAEQLGVSRQAISKWESGQSYPEMDKILLLCKLYNFSLDELMNDNIKEVSETKQSKNNINKYIEDFFDFITKLVGMISSMSFKEVIKLLFEEVIIAGVLFGVYLLIDFLLNLIINNIFGFMELGQIYFHIRSIFSSVYTFIFVIISAVIMFHIFKIRYLDYYETAKDTDAQRPATPEAINETEYAEETNAEVTEEIPQKKKKKIFAPRNKEKVIIRDPKHSRSGFLMGIAKFIVFLFKVIAGIIGISFCISFILLVALTVISFLFIKSGLTFVGAFFALAGLIILNYVILSFIYNFLASKKNRKNLIAILLIASLTSAGLGTGIFAVGTTKFDIIETTATKETVFETEMTDTLYIQNYYSDSEYIETDDSDTVKIVVEQSKYSNWIIEKGKKAVTIRRGDDDEYFFEQLRAFISDINNKKLCLDYNYPMTLSVKVYTSKENIEVLKENFFERNNYYN